MRNRFVLSLAAVSLLGIAGCHHRSADEDSDAINAGVEDLNNTSDEAVADTDAALAAASTLPGNSSNDTNTATPDGAGATVSKADDADKH